MDNSMFFDGGFHRGRGTYGFIINSVEYNGVIDECRSSTEAEYLALIFGLETAISMGMTQLHIQGDSKTVLHHLTGQQKIRKAHNLHKEAMRLLDGITWTIEWIPSRKNPADKLT